jgi:MraZ protein
VGNAEPLKTGLSAPLWLGESEHTLDPKNRVFVPRKFQGGFERDAEGRTVVIVTRGFEGCLFLFSEAGFAQVLARLQTQAFAGAEERRMQRLFFSNASRTTLDASGRLLVPEKLKTMAGIEREVVLVGVVDRVELWPKKVWEAFESRNSEDFDQLDQVLCGGGGEEPSEVPQP